MKHAVVTGALERLRHAADQANGAFPDTQWMRISGPGPEERKLDGAGNFQGMVFEPGQEIVVSCVLTVPGEVGGVTLAGDPLEATLFSLYPSDIRWNGATVFADEGVPVAAGPALFVVVPELKAGDNGTLEFRMRVPSHQTTAWLNLHLTTPGLRARFEALDVAWAQLALAADLAVTPEDEEAVLKAAACVPENLFPGNESELRRAFEEMTTALHPLEGKASRLNVHLIGHSHIDMNWLWTWPDTVEVIQRDFRSVLALMDEFPELTFSHSQPATYEIIRQKEPELFARVLEHIGSGRWEPLTMAWIEGDVNMASGEAHARQLLEGVRYSREVLHAEPSTYHAPDTFGHAGNLPQLAASAGAVRYYHHRANPGKEDRWPAYWWEGQDGTRILAVCTGSYNGDIRARDLVDAALRARRWGHTAGLHFHGIGDHGGGPSRQNLEALRRFRKLPLLPTAKCSTLAAYTDEILKAGGTFPMAAGETRTIFEGCYTTHADTKRFNREGENLLCTADALAALAGQDHSARLQEAWRTVLFNQFHDILDGSAIHEVYAKNAEDFAAVAETAGAVNESALVALAAGLEGGPNRIAVTNPLGWEREDWVTVAKSALPSSLAALAPGSAISLTGDHGHAAVGQVTDHGLGFAARVPAFGTVGYTIEAQAGSPSPALQDVPAFAPTDDRQPVYLAEVSEDTPYQKVETPFFRVFVRRDSGILVSFYDKRVGRELVGYGMRRASDYLDSARADLALSVFQIADEYPHGMSAWHYDEVHTDFSVLRGATTKVVESGPARLTLEVTHTVRKSSIRQRIYFYRDLPRVDFETHVDWQELGGPDAGVPNLKAAFTTRMDDCDAWFETPFAAVKRPSDGQEVPALRWADVGGPDYGFAILNAGKYGCDALGCRLRLTLLRSGYDPDAVSDVGEHTIRYSLFPHPGDWRDAGVVKAGVGYNQPLEARPIAGEAPAAAKAPPPFGLKVTGGDSVLISCLKRSYDGTGRVVRLYESAGRTVEARLEGLESGVRVWETNVVEDRTSQLSVGAGVVRLTFRPWQVRTLLVENPL